MIWIHNASRARVHRFDPDLAEAIETHSGHKVHLCSVVDEETGEKGSAERFERSLAGLHEGLSRPRSCEATVGRFTEQWLKQHRGTISRDQSRDCVGLTYFLCTVSATMRLI